MEKVQQRLITKRLFKSMALHNDRTHEVWNCKPIWTTPRKTKYNVWTEWKKSAESLHWHLILLHSKRIVSCNCFRNWGIPAMMDLHSLLSSGKPSLAICCGVPVQCSWSNSFVNCWVCLSNQLLNRENFFGCRILFLLQNFQSFQNL